MVLLVQQVQSNIVLSLASFLMCSCLHCVTRKNRMPPFHLCDTKYLASPSLLHITLNTTTLASPSLRLPVDCQSIPSRRLPLPCLRHGPKSSLPGRIVHKRSTRAQSSTKSIKISLSYVDTACAGATRLSLCTISSLISATFDLPHHLALPFKSVLTQVRPIIKKWAPVPLQFGSRGRTHARLLWQYLPAISFAHSYLRSWTIRRCPLSGLPVSNVMSSTSITGSQQTWHSNSACGLHVHL